MLSRANDRDREEILELFARATCFVMPSLIEPFGIAYVEAASAGVPSIGASIGGARDIIGEDGGIVVSARRGGRAARRRCSRLADPDTARRMGAAARERAGIYTWVKVAERTFSCSGSRRRTDARWPRFFEHRASSGPTYTLADRASESRDVAPAARARSWWAWGIPLIALAALLGPLVLTSSTFGQDWPNHLWLVWQQSRNITALGHPSYFLQSHLGAFYPFYAFYGGTLYAVVARSPS